MKQITVLIGGPDGTLERRNAYIFGKDADTVRILVGVTEISVSVAPHGGAETEMQSLTTDEIDLLGWGDGIDGTGIEIAFPSGRIVIPRSAIS